MAVTPADIKLMYPTTELDQTIQVYINQAVLILTESRPSSCVLSVARQDLITKYLALHFLAITDSQKASPNGALRRSKLGEADESYEVPAYDINGFNSSRWGQMAIAVDPCGFLAGMSVNNGLKGQFRVV